MVKGCATKVTQNRNDIPPHDGISDAMSPTTLVQGANRLNYEHISKLNFGDYVQVHDPSDVTNTTKARTAGAIALYPSGNAQGSWYFMNLMTGERVHRYQWQRLPLPDEAIDRVHQLAKDEGMPTVKGNFLGF